MRVPLEWLGEMCSWDESPEKLAERLTQSGTEVIAIHSTGCRIPGIFTAKIVEKKPHPNADRLTLCQVDDGSGVRQVVCGAKNHQAGDLVPMARVGTVFPDGMTIKSAKIRGETSEGMLCSPKELGLASETDGLLILPQDTKIGLPLEKLFPGETILEVEITPNRPDLASLEGMAREMGAMGKKRKASKNISKVKLPLLPEWKISVENAEDCPWYSLTALKVRTGVETPGWMKQRLLACGMRNVGLVVDVTNYVLLELGQPLHAFAVGGLQGKEVYIRRAQKGEKLIGLDGGTHLLISEDLVIADSQGPVALAGIVGGKESAVQKETTTLLLESAQFHPGRIRKTARRLSLTTESSRRFGRGGLDPTLAEQARDRVVQLLSDCGALEQAVGTASVGQIDASPRAGIPLRLERVTGVLGMSLDRKGLGERLSGLGFQEKEGRWVPPPWRRDVQEETDLLEELVRLSDLESIPAQLDSLAEELSKEDREEKRRRAIRSFLVERGFTEVLSGSLVKAEEGKAVRLTVPAGPEASCYRDSLLPGLLVAAGNNSAREQVDLKLFEIGRISDVHGKEERRIALLVAGRERPVDWRGGDVSVDSFSLKGVLQEMTLTFPGLPSSWNLREVGSVEKKRAGFKPAAWVAECNLGEAENSKAVRYAALSNFPSISRDLALVLPESVPFAEVEKTVRSSAPAEMESFTVFDRFRDPSGSKVAKGFLSLGCRLHFRSAARTLTEQEVNAWEKKILEALSTRCEAKLRGVL